MRNNDEHSYVGCWTLYALVGILTWITLIVLKVFSVLQISWLVVVLGILWIPTLLLTVTILMGLLSIGVERIYRWYRNMRVKKRIRKDFRFLARGKALDKIAINRGLHRVHGESDEELRERILKLSKRMHRKRRES